MLDDELDMIALIERIQDEARMLDENVPGWWRVPDAVDRIVASKLCSPFDDDWYQHCQRAQWEWQTRGKGEILPHETASVSLPT